MQGALANFVVHIGCAIMNGGPCICCAIVLHPGASQLEEQWAQAMEEGERAVSGSLLSLQMVIASFVCVASNSMMFFPYPA